MKTAFACPTRSIGKWIAVAVGIVVGWLLLQAVHEFGHVLHGWLSGATLARVSIELAGFSYSEFRHNPNPAFVAWGGPLWGGALPLLAWSSARRAPRLRLILAIFAGACLIANGAYLAVGGPMRIADADDLLRRGTPMLALLLVGGAMSGVGLLIWSCEARSVRGAGPERRSAP